MACSLRCVHLYLQTGNSPSLFQVVYDAQ
ncbi:hypothetical protein VCHENC02_0104A, partial [Vibrio harveyi]